MFSVFQNTVYMTKLHPGISKIESGSTSGRDKRCVKLPQHFTVKVARPFIITCMFNGHRRTFTYIARNSSQYTGSVYTLYSAVVGTAVA